jgi:replicative DNA helicase
MGLLDVVIIDYLGLLLLGDSNHYFGKTQEVSEISRRLKSLARELNVPFIVLSQLNRKVEERKDGRPMMSDIRDSGSIEQDADMIIFLHRDDYADQIKSSMSNMVDMEVILDKNRNGPTGVDYIVFDRETGNMREKRREN